MDEALQMPQISVIMPSYNQGKYIEEAILSVISQKGVAAELIVMDGGSTDNTVEILRKYQDRITFRSEPDNGQSHALNKALKLARSRIIGWLNSDDKYMPGAFKTVVSTFKHNPTASLVYGNRVLINADSVCIGVSAQRSFDPRSRNYNICSETAFWIAECVPSLKFREDLKFAMDTHFIATIAKYREHLHINKYIGCFRCHPDSKSSTIWEESAIPEASEVWRLLFGDDLNLVPAKKTREFRFQTLQAFANLPLQQLISYVRHRLTRQKKFD